METTSLKAFAVAQGAKSIQKVNGPNGAFITLLDADKKKITSLPVGKRSQAGTIGEFNVLTTDDGAHIATVNHYEEAESMEL